MQSASLFQSSTKIANFFDFFFFFFLNTEVFYIATKEKTTLKEILLLFQSHLNTQIELVEQIIQPRLNTE